MTKKAKVKANIRGIERVIINSWNEENYLKCDKICKKLLKLKPKNKIALEYQEKLKTISLDTEHDKWFEEAGFGASSIDMLKKIEQ